MKCRLLKDTRLVNPLYSERDARLAVETGVPYNIPSTFEVTAGWILDDPQAWIHCCPGDLNSPPIAEAVDDECREAVRVWMEEKRPLAIAQIKAQIDQIEFIKNPEDRARLLEMGRAYGLIGSEKPKKGNNKSEAPAS
jgi:hypothetical protein